jgi:hypothetical protein
MTNTYEKVDGVLRRTKQEEAPKPQVNDFKLEFLIEQKKAIEAQRDAYVSARNVEIAEIDEMLEECSKLGIATKVEEKEV